MTEHAEALARAFGYMTIAEVGFLKNIAKSVEKTYDGSSLPAHTPVFVNVGAGAGTSALAMREAVPGAIIYSVDKSPGGPLGGFEGETNAFTNVGLQPPIQILGDSGDVAYDWKNGAIDLLFIDDGHGYDDVQRDILSWLPYVRSKGYIAFHDYGSERWPDVRKAADILLEGCSAWTIDTLAVFIKGKQDD